MAFVSFADIPLAKLHHGSTSSLSGCWDCNLAGDPAQGKVRSGGSAAIFATCVLIHLCAPQPQQCLQKVGIEEKSS